MSAHYWLFQNLLLQNLAWLINVVLINFYANIAILVQRYCLGVAFSFTLARACKKMRIALRKVGDWQKSVKKHIFS